MTTDPCPPVPLLQLHHVRGEPADLCVAHEEDVAEDGALRTAVALVDPYRALRDDNVALFDHLADGDASSRGPIGSLSPMYTFGRDPRSDSPTRR